ncbi:MAG: DUF4845 domain-containing protein [Burkholderiaceae bacterium]
MKLSAFSRGRATAPRKRQQGLSILLFMLIAVAVVTLGGATLKILPTFLEYRAVQGAIDKIIKETTDPAEVSRSFNKMAQIDDIKSIVGDDLVVEKEGEGGKISFAYEKRVPLFGPVNILMDYRGSASVAR